MIVVAILGHLFICVLAKIRKVQLEYFVIINNIRKYFIETDYLLWNVVQLSDKTLRVRGDVILAELEQHYNLKWGDTNAITIGGLVMILLGDIPKQNDTVEFRNVSILVEETEGMAVKTVLIQLPE